MRSLTPPLKLLVASQQKASVGKEEILQDLRDTGSATSFFLAEKEKLVEKKLIYKETLK